MSFYEGRKMRIRVGSGLSEELPVKACVYQRSGLPPVYFAIVVYMATEGARKGLMNEILCANDLVLTSETMEKFQKWKEQAFKKE